MTRSIRRSRGLAASCLAAGLISPSAGAALAAPVAAAAANTGTRHTAPSSEADEVRVRAESYEQVSPGHIEARGLVDLQLADMRIEADRADVFEQRKPDGTIERRVVAEGNVVFLRGAERLSGDRLELDGSGRGVLLNAVGYVEPGVFVEARRVERVDAKTYRVEGAKFTSCAQASPRWSVNATKATIHIGDKLTVRNAVFELKGLPAFYAPFLLYPIPKNGRATGFLLPHLGLSRSRGFEAGVGFFWVLGRSADQTLYFDHVGRAGQGYGHDLRWSGLSPARGSLRTYLFDATGPGKLDYDIDWNALQTLPSGSRATLSIRTFSSLLFERRFQDDFALALNPVERGSAALERDFSFARLSLYGDVSRTRNDAGWTMAGRLPALGVTRFPRRIGLGGLVFGLSAAAERVLDGDQDRVDDWSRADVRPTLSRPFRLSFLELNPSLGYRYTRYGSRLATDAAGATAIVPTPIERSYFEASMEMRGPTFARVFDTPGLGYSERFKHTIGPEATFIYRTSVDGLDAIPHSSLGSEDSLRGTEEIRYGLVQRLYAKRRGAGGRLNRTSCFRGISRRSTTSGSPADPLPTPTPCLRSWVRPAGPSTSHRSPRGCACTRRPTTPWTTTSSTTSTSGNSCR